MNELQIIRLSALVKLLSISKSSLYLWLNPKSKQFKADFPARIKISERCVGWKKVDIEQWIENRQLNANINK
jgi:prophage regulatory protein